MSCLLYPTWTKKLYAIVNVRKLINTANYSIFKSVDVNGSNRQSIDVP
jgi:hypothetical protein